MLEEAEEIGSYFQFKKISKGEYFVKEGNICRHLAFIESGFFQYYINLNGEEKTTYTLGSNNLIVSLVSFLRQVSSKENIRAAVNSGIWVISKEDFDHLPNRIPTFKNYYIKLLEWQLCCIEESRIDGIILSAGERYAKMMAKEPDLIQQVPMQFLASIIGVTPRHLSRIRNNIRIPN